jgi:hypothetical protein
MVLRPVRLPDEGPGFSGGSLPGHFPYKRHINFSCHYYSCSVHSGGLKDEVESNFSISAIVHLPCRPGGISNRSPGTGLSDRLDPLSVDPLVRPLDPEHTTEYLQRLGEIGALPPEADLAGRWSLELRDDRLRTLNLNLFQNGRVVFGRGDMTANGVTQIASASGLISQDVLYLDIVSLDDQMLYRCVLRPGVDTLTGSYYAFGPQGAVLSGTVSGSRYQ